MQRLVQFFQVIFFTLLLLHFTEAAAQLSKSAQFWPEINLSSKPFKKSTIQLDILSNRESDLNESNLFKYQSQLGARIWFNHYFRAKVKSSFFFETLLNSEVPEIDARNYMEYRIALQNTYYMQTGRWTLSHRIRIENRILEDVTGKYVMALRPRYQLKSIIALNKRNLIRGTLYFIAANEFMVNTGSSVTGHHFFDRDMVQAGLGYCITDNVIVESMYVYTYRLLPEERGILSINSWQLTLICNNVFTGKYLKGFFEPK